MGESFITILRDLALNTDTLIHSYKITNDKYRGRLWLNKSFCYNYRYIVWSRLNNVNLLYKLYFKGDYIMMDNGHNNNNVNLIAKFIYFSCFISSYKDIFYLVYSVYTMNLYIRNMADIEKGWYILKYNWNKTFCYKLQRIGSFEKEYFE